MVKIILKRESQCKTHSSVEFLHFILSHIHITSQNFMRLPASAKLDFKQKV